MADNGESTCTPELESENSQNKTQFKRIYSKCTKCIIDNWCTRVATLISVVAGILGLVIVLVPGILPSGPVDISCDCLNGTSMDTRTADSRKAGFKPSSTSNSAMDSSTEDSTQCSCFSCDFGFQLKGGICILNECKCDDGVAGLCTEDRHEFKQFCEFCETGFHLNTEFDFDIFDTQRKCDLNTCVCQNGNADIGPGCNFHEANSCRVCFAGYKHITIDNHTSECTSIDTIKTTTTPVSTTTNVGFVKPKQIFMYYRNAYSKIWSETSTNPMKNITIHVYSPVIVVSGENYPQFLTEIKLPAQTFSPHLVYNRRKIGIEIIGDYEYNVNSLSPLLNDNHYFIPVFNLKSDGIVLTSFGTLEDVDDSFYLAVGECMHSQIWNNSGSDVSINVIFCEWIEQILNNDFMKFYQICV